MSYQEDKGQLNRAFPKGPIPQGPIPQEWANKLKAARKSRQMRGERRVITMLFCDVTGSTSMAENLDPEEWAEIMNEAFDFLIAPIYKYEGTLARMMGDGLLAFFGAPVAHEDDPQRAVMAGLDIIKNLGPYRQEVKTLFGLDFNVRVGINTGPVVVGEIGSDLAMEYTAMGDAINLASRMEETAKPGTVQISAHTYKRVHPFFDVEPLGATTVKGRSGVVQTYRAIARKEMPGRLRGIEGLDSPIVGRDQELNQLRDIIAAFPDKGGHIFCLTGEAGLGKSRIIRELKEIWQLKYPDPKTWMESSGIAYESDRPYSLFFQVLQKSFGILDEDSSGEIRKKIAVSLLTLPDKKQLVVKRAIETLLAVEDSERPQIDAESLKRQLFEAFTTVWQSSLSTMPAVRIFDDLHWADPASVELIIHLMQLVESNPILFIFAARPDNKSAGWEIVTTADETHPEVTTRIDLTPLSPDDSDAMVSNLLAVAELPPEMRQLILTKSEGNPFFVEEIVRELIDIKSLVRDESGLRWRAAKNIEDIAIPDNLQSLLISRIDRIEKGTKRTLQLASVIGRTFLYQVLAGVSETLEGLSNHLSSLQEVDLIFESAVVPELEYMFRHELTRDAAYRTILHRQRRKYHLQVGMALETMMADRLGEEAHRLAYHFSQAGDLQRSLKYATMAGGTAAQLYANKEAVNYYQQALIIGKEIGSVDQQIDIYLSLGRVLEVTNQYDLALNIYQDMYNFGASGKRSTLMLEALMAQALLYATYTSLFNPGKARKTLEEALELAQQENNHRAEAKIFWIFMLVTSFDEGDSDKAILNGQRSLVIAREHNFEEQLAYTLHDLSRSYASSGQFPEALAALKEAGSLFREQGNLPMLADNRTTLAYGYTMMGKLQDAQSLCEEAVAVSRESGSLWGESYALNQLSLIRFEQGLISQAFDGWRRSITISIKANFIGGGSFAKLYMSRAFGYLGAYDQGLSYVNEAFSEIKQESFQQEEPEALIVKAMLQADRGDVRNARLTIGEVGKNTDKLNRSNLLILQFYSVAQVHVYFAAGEYEKVIALANEHVRDLHLKGVLLSVPALLFMRGRAEMALGRLKDARETFSRAHKDAQEMGIRRQLWPILVNWSEIEEKLGNQEFKEELTTLAKEEIHFIISQIDDQELKQTFIALSQVHPFIQ
jgi:predicted ATPase/class 3 adenylate cyclase